MAEIVRITYAILIIIAICVNSITADFTPDFRKFLDQRYGENSADRLARTDADGVYAGSFGGLDSKNDVLTHNPVIFVHGLTMSANAFQMHRKYFMEYNYTNAELYGTTYSDAGRTAFFRKTMDCEDVKIIREFISAVHDYTNRTVNVIAYSMGVAISRKAILGGKCVDKDHYLGGPITPLVNVYIAIAGVAYGYEQCHKIHKACNVVNGMSCDSKYIQDVNSKAVAYEGKHTYAIFSRNDHLVGQKCCGYQCSTLKNAAALFEENSYGHVSILFQTIELQYTIIQNETITAVKRI